MPTPKDAQKEQLVLSLDLGANSGGWFLLRIPRTAENKDRPESWKDGYLEGGKIVQAGVRIFTAGKENFDSAKEKSLCEDRRKARGARRRLRRRNQRKRKLKELLVESGFWADSMDMDKSANDPLELRARGIEEQLDLKEFGQALYHMAQRRGFRSARKTKVDKPGKGKTGKSQPDGDAVSEEAKSGDAEEKKENILAKIDQLNEAIEQSGKKTLGAYLFSLREQDEHLRIRKRYTRRDMYVREFELLWAEQAKHHRKILTSELKDKIYAILFYQRNIYWRQTTIGQCELEPDEPRCPRADRLAQEFRFFQEINNLKYIDPNTYDEIRVADNPTSLKEIVELGRKKENVKFDEIRKILGLEGTSTRFNLETGQKKKGKKAETEEMVFRSYLKGFETDAVLRRPKYFGKNWDAIHEEERNKIVRILIERPADPDSDKMEFDAKGRARQMDEEQFRAYMAKHWQKKPYSLTDEQIDEILDNIENDLPKNYLSLSRKALAKLLPFMRQGLLFSGPAGKDGSYNDALHGAGYVRRDEENEWDVFAELPLAENLKGLGAINNPVVRRIVNEARRLINAIIRQYGRPDRIHVELARSAKASSEKRKDISAQNNLNQKEREAAKNYLRSVGINPTGDALLRLRLWRQQGGVCPYSDQEEQKADCPYSSKQISFDQLFSESIVDVDHILPYSLTLDDSQMNKVVCFASANRDKGQQSPYEWLAHRDPERFERMKERVDKFKCHTDKKKKFTQEEIDKEGFSKRQLIDTQYASRYLLQYLRCLYKPEEYRNEKGKHDPRVTACKGTFTAKLRRHWGLNNILHDVQYKDEELLLIEKCFDVVRLWSTTKYQSLTEYLKTRSDYKKDKEPKFQEDYIRSLSDIETGYENLESKNAPLSDYVIKRLKSWKGNHKNRADHRHHAVDALVIALTDLKLMGKLQNHAKICSEQGYKPFPRPWGSFRSNAEKAINDIVVSHRPVGRVRGGLHNDTNYGPVLDRESGERKEGVFVVRKALTSLTKVELFKIRDERIKKIVFERLAEFGIEPGQKGKGLINEETGEKAKVGEIKEVLGEELLQDLPKEFVKKLSSPDFSKLAEELKSVILSTLDDGGICYSEELFCDADVLRKKLKESSKEDYKKLAEKITNDNALKNGLKVAFAEPLRMLPERMKADAKTENFPEIKNVRIFVKNQTAQQVKKDGPFLIPGRNHHICLFEFTDAKGKPVREAVFTSRLEANRRLLEQQRLIREKRKELKSQGLPQEETERQLREYRRIVVTEKEPLVWRVHPERPTARFLFSLKSGEMFRVMDGTEVRLVIYDTAASTSGQMIFIDARDAQKKPRKISKSGASYFDILEKVQVDRLGGITPAND